MAHDFTLLRVEAGTIALTGTLDANEATDIIGMGPTCAASGSTAGAATCRVLLGGAGSDVHFSLTDTEIDRVTTNGKLFMGDPELANIHEAHGLGGAIVFQRTGVMMAYRPDIVDEHDQGEELLHVFGNEESAAHWFRIYFLLLGRHVFETE